MKATFFERLGSYLIDTIIVFITSLYLYKETKNKTTRKSSKNALK